MAVPHEPPWTLTKDEDDRGREIDALYALATRMRDQEPAEWPDQLLMIGDQVYADEDAPRTRAYIRTRRDTSGGPGEHVQDFEEYAHLYGETWGDPLIRWLLSTVPVATPFDDHDVHDDWNTSQAWVDELRKKPCRAGVPDPPLDWAVTDGPLFDNQVGIVEIAGRTARVGVERTTGADWRRPALTTSLDRRLV